MKKMTKQFEVTFKDTTGKNRFENEYGFGTNPPAIFHARNKIDLRRILMPKLNADKIKIVSIMQVD